jgi:hypothetical protein
MPSDPRPGARLAAEQSASVFERNHAAWDAAERSVLAGEVPLGRYFAGKPSAEERRRMLLRESAPAAASAAPPAEPDTPTTVPGFYAGLSPAQREAHLDALLQAQSDAGDAFGGVTADESEAAE